MELKKPSVFCRQQKICLSVDEIFQEFLLKKMFEELQLEFLRENQMLLPYDTTCQGIFYVFLHAISIYLIYGTL